MLSVRMLGVFTILADEARLAIDLGPSGRMLAGYLFEFAGRTHRRERLAELFWGHLDPERSRAALNTALWRVRKILHADAAHKSGNGLHTSGSEVVLEPGPALNIDTRRFTLAVKNALALPQLSASNPVLCHLEEAVEGYTGAFLDGDEADWVMEERERLHSLFVRAASELLRIYGHIQRYEEGIAVARRLLALDPFRESVVRSLLILLVLNGQRAESLRYHERWRVLFRRELNIEPAPQTLRLVDQVRSGHIFEELDSIRDSYFLPRRPQQEP
jgi:DNA-binding SARP family transcriptional activator